MANQADNQQISTSLGSVEPVPSRQVGHEDKGLLSPTQDENTEKRRCHYGETDRNFGAPIMQFEPEEMMVNQIPTPNNITRDDVIQGKYNSVTGFGRAMSQ